MKKRLKNCSDWGGEGGGGAERGGCLFKVNMYLNAFCWHKCISGFSGLFTASSLSAWCTESRKQESRDNIFIPAHTPITLFPLFSCLLVNKVFHIQQRAEYCFQESAHSHIRQQAWLYSITDLCCIWMLKRVLRIFLNLMVAIFFEKEIYHISV